VLPDPVFVLLPVVLELPGLAVPLEVPLDPAPLFAAPPPPAAPPPAPPAPPAPPPPPWASAAVLRTSADINTVGNSLDIAISIMSPARG
jgi:hypothetical protein